MNTDKKTSECCQGKPIIKHHYHGGASNPIYGLGVIGALFYFLQSATTFSLIVVGIVKSIFWPAVLMYELLTYISL